MTMSHTVTPCPRSACRALYALARFACGSCSIESRNGSDAFMAVESARAEFYIAQGSCLFRSALDHSVEKTRISRKKKRKRERKKKVCTGQAIAVHDVVPTLPGWYPSGD